jgi:hypothetical protein
MVAMVETVWVLDRAYGLAAYEIASAVERLLQADVLVVENEPEVFTAMIALKEGTGIVRRHRHRCARHESQLFLHSDIRPQGSLAFGVQASLIRARGVFETINVTEFLGLQRGCWADSLLLLRTIRCRVSQLSFKYPSYSESPA